MLVDHEWRALTPNICITFTPAVLAYQAVPAAGRLRKDMTWWRNLSRSASDSTCPPEHLYAGRWVLGSYQYTGEFFYEMAKAS